ncbi:MAG: RdgB/HAM1 family non-canonical purine NTP pyrophosphatase [Gemmatimonadota bacterium]
MKLLLATRSADKLREAREILSGVEGLQLVGLDEAGIPERAEEASIEAFDTFEENAAAKARYFLRRSGMLTVADDSGIAVDALDGRPGVHSKRFAPETRLSDGSSRDLANNEYLLELLQDVPEPNRTARYVCVLALVEGEGPVSFFRGEVEGSILGEPRGSGGFGYDPLFYHHELGRTFGEVGREVKGELSHRGVAFRHLHDHLGTLEEGSR